MKSWKLIDYAQVTTPNPISITGVLLCDAQMIFTLHHTLTLSIPQAPGLPPTGYKHIFQHKLNFDCGNLSPLWEFAQHSLQSRKSKSIIILSDD